MSQREYNWRKNGGFVSENRIRSLRIASPTLIFCNTSDASQWLRCSLRLRRPCILRPTRVVITEVAKHGSQQELWSMVFHGSGDQKNRGNAKNNMPQSEQTGKRSLQLESPPVETTAAFTTRRWYTFWWLTFPNKTSEKNAYTQQRRDNTHAGLTTEQLDKQLNIRDITTTHALITHWGSRILKYNVRIPARKRY